MIYGSGSIKKNGIYDDVIKILEAQGKNVAEIAGVMPNPTLAKLYEGIEIARKHQADLLLAVGGGSVCDYAKGKSTDWMVHMLGQAVGAHTNATHGMMLAAVSLPYYRYILACRNSSASPLKSGRSTRKARQMRRLPRKASRPWKIG